MELRADPNYRSMYVYQLNRIYTNRITDVLKEAVALGLFRNDIPVRLVRNLIFGGIEHQTWAYLLGEGDFDVDLVADGIADLVYQGMTPSPTRMGSARPKSTGAIALSKISAPLKKRSSRPIADAATAATSRKRKNAPV